MLQKMVSHNIFNIFMHVGYPTPAFDPRLSGIVPEENYGISVSPKIVQEYVKLLRSVDSRLKLWAWFGTYSTLGTGDSSGHALAKVDLSTAYNRSVIIENIVKVASWGFYGVQDDTEDVIQVTNLSQRYQDQTNFWNEEQIALNQVDVKLAVFKYFGPPSLWAVKEYVPQLSVDYVIAVGDSRQSQEIYSVYGPIEEIWKNEIATGLSVASSPVIVHLAAYNSLFSFKTRLTCLSEIPNSFVGVSIYEYSMITDSDWVAWDNYLSSIGYEPEPDPEPKPEPEPSGDTRFLYWSLLVALGILLIVFFASSGMKRND